MLAWLRCGCLLPLLLALLLPCGEAVAGLQPSRRLKTRSVVILVLDGPRQSEMWGDPQARHIPELSARLRPLGSLFLGFLNQGPTYTSAGHAAITTGVYQDLENSKGAELPTQPGIFHYFLRASGLPKSKAWVIASKDKLAILAATRAPGWDAYNPSCWSGKGGAGLGSGYGEDAETLAAAERILARDRPKLVLINLKEPDSGGHSGKWENYLEGLHHSDRRALELHQFLQKQAYYAGRTALLITHDHGRHLDGVKDGFVSHGDACPGCRANALLALGPDFKAGATFESGGEIIDISATVGRLLGFAVPSSQGRVLREAFRP